MDLAEEVELSLYNPRALSLFCMALILSLKGSGSEIVAFPKTNLMTLSM
jgi:hypothetical protein